MGKAQRDKGKRGEREAAVELTKALGVLVERTRQFKGSPNSADLEGVDGLHFEVKRTERLSLYPAIEAGRAGRGRQLPASAAQKERPALGGHRVFA